jgi:dienelactone hydrolase
VRLQAIKRIAGLFVLPLALLLAVLVYVSALWQPPYLVEKLSFKTNTVEGTTNEKPVDVSAALYLPRHAILPLSAVVIAPSSSGIETAREVFYAQRLARIGIAALIIDSFSARNVTSSVYDQSLLESWQVENDAIAALQWLRADPRFANQPVAIMGVSKGGTVALDSASIVRRKWTGITDIAFAAHIAISPDCTWTMRSDRTTGAPIFIMMAELDDQTPFAPCLAKAERMRAAGNAHVTTKVYKGAYHAWEELGAAPYRDPDVENYAQCRVWIENDGSMIAADTNEPVPEQNWHDWAKQSCMTLGASCCGGNRVLKNEAFRDIVAFLKRAGFKTRPHK